jgi:hypothetical protein
LPSSEKTSQRLAFDLLGSESLPISNLVPHDREAVAAAQFRTLLKAATHDKAQPWRRFQLLNVVVAWLADSDRCTKPELLDLLLQVRAVAQKLDGPADTEWKQALARERSWSRIVRGSEQTTPAPTAGAGGVTSESRAPSRPESPSAVPVGESKRRDGVADNPPGLPLEDALSVIQSLRDRRSREVLALDRVTAGLRAAEARSRQYELDARSARDEAQKARAKADEHESAAERLQARVADLETRHAHITQQLHERDAELEQLSAQFSNLHEELRGEQARHDKDAATWADQKRQFEVQIVEHADAVLNELRQRLADRVTKLIGDVPIRADAMKGNTAAAVLNTRIHEILDALRSESVPVRVKGEG